MLRQLFKRFFEVIVTMFGRRIVDQRTGQLLGRAIALPTSRGWLLLGLHHPYVRPVFLPEDRVRYGRHSIGFATHPPVDYPSIPNCKIPFVPESKIQNSKFRISNPSAISSPQHSPFALSAPESNIHRPSSNISPPPPAHSCLWAVLVHQSAAECRSILARWTDAGYHPSSILLVHGGNRKDFEAIDFANAVFVPDASLRTVRHPVEKQSYSGPMREISEWMSDRPFNHVCLLEYDHLPLVADWGDRLESLLTSEDADVLFHHLVRVDGTNAPHYLHHLADPRFTRAWESISKREDPRVVLNCMATGSYWTREAFDAVANISAFHFPLSDFPSIYLEMDLPTTAHHLGFRVRDIGNQNRFVNISPRTHADLDSARTQGAWSLHPVKGM